MRTLLFLALMTLSSVIYSQKLYTLYFTPHQTNVFPDGLSLNKTDQYYQMEMRGDTLHIWNKALQFVVYKNQTELSFNNIFDGLYKSELLNMDPHYFIIYFEDMKSYYFFFELFDWMPFPDSPYMYSVQQTTSISTNMQ
jgi:hypothetical protein